MWATPGAVFSNISLGVSITVCREVTFPTDLIPHQGPVRVDQVQQLHQLSHSRAQASFETNLKLRSQIDFFEDIGRVRETHPLTHEAFATHNVSYSILNFRELTNPINKLFSMALEQLHQEFVGGGQVPCQELALVPHHEVLGSVNPLSSLLIADC